jgi:hypothetical protein
MAAFHEVYKINNHLKFLLCLVRFFAQHPIGANPTKMGSQVSEAQGLVSTPKETLSHTMPG